jgi:Rgg/GadR/MutR family transcriptional activator
MKDLSTKKMTIGKLLKKHRISQGKTQQEWVHNIISRSFYGKVEREVHQINVEDLLNLLHYNNISVFHFFSELNDQDNILNQKENIIRKMIIDAYYKNSTSALSKIKEKIENIELPNKNELLIIIKVFTVLINKKYSYITENDKKVIMNTFFNKNFFEKDNLKIYCNFMRFYSFENNLFMTKRIINRLDNTQDIQQQIIILSITINMLGFCIEKNHYQEADFFIKAADKIITDPKTFFYKSVITLFKNIIYYRSNPQTCYLDNCKLIIKLFKINGMSEYSNELNAFLTSYIGK